MGEGCGAQPESPLRGRRFSPRPTPNDHDPAWFVRPGRGFGSGASAPVGRGYGSVEFGKFRAGLMNGRMGDWEDGRMGEGAARSGSSPFGGGRSGSELPGTLVGRGVALGRGQAPQWGAATGVSR
jgi:hypothetical protein